MSSAKADEAEIVQLGQSDKNISDQNILVMVHYKNKTAEMYTFDLKGKVVVWSQHKYGTFSNRASTFVSKCR